MLEDSKTHGLDVQHNDNTTTYGTTDVNEDIDGELATDSEDENSNTDSETSDENESTDNKGTIIRPRDESPNSKKVGFIFNLHGNDSEHNTKDEINR